jgi:hypothetical protein
VEEWAKRIGVAFIIAVGGMYVLWVVGALMLLLGTWLDNIIPAVYMLMVAAALFVGIVVADWMIDTFNRRRP